MNSSAIKGKKEMKKYWRLKWLKEGYFLQVNMMKQEKGKRFRSIYKRMIIVIVHDI